MLKTKANPEINTKVNLLVVDDHLDNLRTLSLILQSEGYKVRKATSGAMALETVYIQLPDLILLDIRMSIMDGFEVCTILKRSPQTCSIPILFISASDAVDDKVKAFEAGGADYITKPFKSQEVLARIQHQLTIQSQYQQLQNFNADLESQVQARTLELEQALAFEQTLKRISDQVRDTLDQNQILQTVVEELVSALGCHAVFYNPDRLNQTICHQSGCLAALQTLSLADAPEVYEQLQQRYCFAFCRLPPPSTQHHLSILACPIFDNQFDHPLEKTGIIGNLWVFKANQSSFSKQEIHLVEQVANQCAIALRQAQLYKSSQRQVSELERLNQLKDNFLSTISHELKTPLSNMKLALRMLDSLTHQATHQEQFLEQVSQPNPSSHKASRYFEILKEECDRELQLVNDLLDLQHLEAGVHVIDPIEMDLQKWLPHVIETIQTRIQTQQKILQLKIESNIPPLKTDFTTLSRVIKELLNNACKYTPVNETIIVSASLEEETVCIEICNTGVEIAPEELPYIFDKFYRIVSNDPWKHSGTGLGLALVKKLVEQLGGSITVKNHNQMICFAVHLPLSAR